MNFPKRVQTLWAQMLCNESQTHNQSDTEHKNWSLTMTASNGNISWVTGPLCGEFTGHKGQWCRALMFSLICAWINGWVNNREAGDLRRHRAHYDVIIMSRPHFENKANQIYLTHSHHIQTMGMSPLYWPNTPHPRNHKYKWSYQISMKTSKILELDDDHRSD